MTTITRTPMSRVLLLASAVSVATAAALAIMPIVPCTPATAAERETPQIGSPAPDFTGTDSNGKVVKLSELRGRTVVLEWSNHECPFVGKHYRSGNMQTLQKDATLQGAVWLTILSSAPGTQGNVTAAEANSLTEKRQAAPTAVVIDPSGTIGRLYGARTTPHMFVIDKGGILRYMGGIDDKPTTSVADVATAKNYVRLALTAVAAGGAVAEPITRPYGCSIKYD